jgi:hypothetical protein
MKFSDRVFGCILALLIFLNYIDAFATMYWTSNGYAAETNPIMNGWLQISYAAFLFIKMFFVITSCFFLWKVRKYKLAHILVFLIFLIYAYITIMHCNIALKVLYN